MNTQLFRPMLACDISESDLDSLTYPVIVQPKIDGIRCIIKEGKVLSRTLKKIPNDFIRKQLRKLWMLDEGFLFDGELTLKDKIATFQDIQSAVMTKIGIPDFQFTMFDYIETELKFDDTYEHRFIENICMPQSINWSVCVISHRCNSKQDVLNKELELLEKGYEGIIIRSPSGLYKFGRSTLSESYLLKLKRTETATALIIGFEQGSTNANEAEINSLGLTERSSAIGNKIPTNTLGAFKVRGLDGEFKDKEFNVATGILTHIGKEEIWYNQDMYIGVTIVYKYQKIGSKDLPRQPRFWTYTL